jgi:hypothetical protein
VGLVQGGRALQGRIAVESLGLVSDAAGSM